MDNFDHCHIHNSFFGNYFWSNTGNNFVQHLTWHSQEYIDWNFYIHNIFKTFDLVTDIKMQPNFVRDNMQQNINMALLTWNKYCCPKQYLAIKYNFYHIEFSTMINKTSQELRMLSSVTIICQVTKIFMNSGSQLSEL